MRTALVLTLIAGNAFAQETPEALDALAAQYRSQGKLAEADGVLDRLVALAPAVENIEKSARMKAALAQYERAEQLYEQALSLRLDRDAQPVLSIPVRRQLIQVLIAQAKFSPATQQAFIAIGLRERAAGKDHPELAGDYAVLARVYQAQRVWDQAARTWAEALRIQTAAFGANDLRLADTLDNLAGCQSELKDVDGALASLLQALNIRESVLGPMHTDVAQTTDMLGQLLYSAARYAEAEPYFERSLAIFLSFLGPGSAQLARNYDNLAVTEAMQQKYAEAAEHYGQALKIRDTDNALNLHHLGLVQAAGENGPAAEAIYRRLLALLEVTSSPNAELKATAASEYDKLRRELQSKQPVRAPRAPVAAKQK